MIMEQTYISKPTRNASQRGRTRILSRAGEPMFYADWDRALFIHYQVESEALQRWVPYPLDLHEGHAYVSLVAFTMRGMRLRVAGAFGKKLFAPIGTHTFLNVRTYVNQGGEPGIYFMREWLPNRLAVCLGPGAFGLPYRYGDLNYKHCHEDGRLSGRVCVRQGLLNYQVNLPDKNFQPVDEEGLGGFLLERYTAFTNGLGVRRFFRVWHEPWQQVEVDVEITKNTLLTCAPGGEGWAERARLIGGNYSPGAKGVWMGRPHLVA